jgi:hypothetical protein
MNSKMQVIYIKHTGHILAAFTRTADPEGKPSFLPADEEDQRSLLIRDPDGRSVALSVPASVVEQKAFDFDPGVFASPTLHIVTETGVEPLNTLSLPSVSAPKKETIDVQASGGNVSEDTNVWIQLDEVNPLNTEDPIRRVMTGLIEKNDSGVTLVMKSRPDDQPAPVRTGSYYALVFVAGELPLFTTVSVP